MKFNSKSHLAYCIGTHFNTQLTRALTFADEVIEIVGQNSIKFGDIKLNEDEKGKSLSFVPHSYNSEIAFESCVMKPISAGSDFYETILQGRFKGTSSKVIIHRKDDLCMASIVIEEGIRGIYYIRFNANNDQKSGMGRFRLKYYDGGVLDVIRSATKSGSNKLPKFKEFGELISYDDQSLRDIGFDPDYEKEGIISKDYRSIIFQTFKNASLEKFEESVAKHFDEKGFEYTKQ